MEERHFLVDFKKLPFRRACRMGGPIFASIIWIKAALKKQWITNFPVSMGRAYEAQPIEATDIDAELRPTFDRLVPELQRLGFTEISYKRFPEASLPSAVVCTLIHNNREQVAEIAASERRPGLVWSSVSIFSLHGNKSLNVSDSPESWMSRDEQESELIAFGGTTPEGLYRLHTDVIARRRNEHPPRRWEDFEMIADESRAWLERQVDRFVASGYYIQISADEAAKLRDTFVEARRRALEKIRVSR